MARPNQHTHPWDKESVDILYKEYPSTDTSILAKKLNRTISSIETKAGKLKIKKLYSCDNLDINKIVDFLNNGYKIEQISKIFNVSRTSLWRFCKKNNISPKNFYKNFYAPRSSEGRKYRVRQDLPKECEICGFSRTLDVAHIIPAREKGPLDSWNCLSLCPNHHRLFDENRLNSNEYVLIENKIKLAKETFDQLIKLEKFKNIQGNNL